jgi:transcriptional regulator with XRE-family HTH domain
MKTLGQYVKEQKKVDPEFAVACDEAEKQLRFSVQLARLREARQLTQQALADRIGIKQGQLARYETGQMPRVETLQKLMGALGARVIIQGETIELEVLDEQHLESPSQSHELAA